MGRINHEASSALRVEFLVFDLMRTIPCHLFNYVIFTEAITHLPRTLLRECESIELSG
jgi:hypothetical protein